MEIIPILFFFTLIYCLGYSVTSFAKKPENYLERNLMYIMLGLAVLPILAVVLNLFRIPIVWWVFLILAVIKPAYDLSRKINEKKISFPKFSINKKPVVKGQLANPAQCA